MLRQIYSYLPSCRVSPPLGRFQIYCLVTVAYGYQQLAQGYYLIVTRPTIL